MILSESEKNRIRGLHREVLNEMRFDGKSTGLFSDEETTMNELEIDEGDCGDLDEGHCSSKGRNEEVNELNKSTYNNAAAQAMERGDEDLAIDFLKHSNNMGIDGDLKYDPTKVVHNDEDHIVVDRDKEDEEFTYDKDDVSYMDDEWLVIDKDEEEELPTVRRSDRDRARRRPYSPQARFRGGLSEQERPPLALDRELSFVLDEIHDDLFYTLPGQFQEYNLGEQVRLYQELKSRLDSYPASKSLPEVKQILDRMEYDLSGLEGFNERLGNLFYILTGRYEFSPEGRQQ